MQVFVSFVFLVLSPYLLCLQNWTGRGFSRRISILCSCLSCWYTSASPLDFHPRLLPIISNVFLIFCACTWKVAVSLVANCSDLAPFVHAETLWALWFHLSPSPGSRQLEGASTWSCWKLCTMTHVSLATAFSICRTPCLFLSMNQL